MKNSFEIVKVTSTKLDRLQQICRQTFYETFASSNSEENMREYLNDCFSLPKLSSELNDSNSDFYFAMFENKVIGYLKINAGESQTALKEEKAIEIERIYVLSEFQGKDVGQNLFAQALRVAEQKRADYIWLGVWEENPRAIQFYKKNGFVEFDKHVFKLGNDEQTDIMMKLKLKM
jgi:ribosomal protein S18 acetylase RimI-like enzyme